MAAAMVERATGTGRNDASAPRRLGRDGIAVWLASSRPDGRPHLLPLWYRWDGDDLVVRSKPNAQKVRNVREDPRVVLAFGSVENGMDVDIVEGVAELPGLEPGITAGDAGFERYGDLMAGLGLDLELFCRTYSQPIRIRLDRRLDWGQPGWAGRG